MQDEACPKVLKDLPRKKAGHGVVTLHISIVNMEIGYSLIDLDPSVNSLSRYVVDRIGYLQVKTYARDLQMANKTCRKPVGAIKDVLIQFDNHIFPLEILILYVKVGPKIPRILEDLS